VILIKTNDPIIYVIIAKLGATYSIFISSFHSIREALVSQGDTYKMPSYESFSNSFIREQDKLLHLGVINTAYTCNKALLAQHNDKARNPNKQHPRNNK
jgi:hypothetical protein